MVATEDANSPPFRALAVEIELPDGSASSDSVDWQQLDSRGGVVIGRVKPAHIVVPRSAVSRRHFQLEAGPGGTVAVRDLGSKNGTFLDGKRLGNDDPGVLGEDSVVEAGDIKFRFTFEGAEESGGAQTEIPAADDFERWEFIVRGGGAESVTHSVSSGDLRRLQGIVFGRRKSDADIVLLDPTVSRAHCRINLDEGGHLSITDLDSRNGTTLNGIQLKPAERTFVSPTDSIELGAARLSIVAPESFEASALDADSDVTVIAPQPESEDSDVDQTIVVGDKAREPPAKSSFASLRVLIESPDGGVHEEIVDDTVLISATGCTVGRSTLAGIVIQDATVSRLHCRLNATSSGTIEIRDLGSHNGTFVDGQRLEAEEAAPIWERSLVQVGDLKFRIKFSTDEELAKSLPPNPEETLTYALESEGAEAAQNPDRTVVDFVDDATVVDIRPDAPHAAASTAPPSGGAEQPLASRETKPESPPPAPSAPLPATATAAAGSRAPAFLNVSGSLIVPLAIVLAAAGIAFGSPDITELTARVLVGLILASVAAYACIGVAGEIRRRRHSRSVQDLELERIRRDISLSAARLAREEESVAGTWSGFRKYEVQRKVSEGGDICSFYLVPHDGKPHPKFAPGQHITFQLRVPDQTKPVVRCYTLSDSPFESGYYRVSIKRALPPRDREDAPPGLSSNYFHDFVRQGDILDIRAPSGKFFLDLYKNSPIVLIGGGIGITPALSMVNAVANAGSHREVWLFYGVRHGDEHIMKDHFAQLERDYDNINVRICYSDPREGVDRPDIDYDIGERVSVDLMKRLLPSNNYDFYICGPPPMMESLVSGLEEWGVPDDAIHFEAFGPATVKRASKNRAAVEEKIEANVTFSKSEQIVSWSGEQSSLLEFAESNGIAMESGCRAGSCGQCLCALRSGKVRYLEEPGIDPDPGSCLTCISVPDGDVVLEA